MLTVHVERGTRSRYEARKDMLMGVTKTNKVTPDQVCKLADAVAEELQGGWVCLLHTECCWMKTCARTGLASSEILRTTKQSALARGGPHVRLRFGLQTWTARIICRHCYLAPPRMLHILHAHRLRPVVPFFALGISLQFQSQTADEDYFQKVFSPYFNLQKVAMATYVMNLTKDVSKCLGSDGVV